MEGHQRTLLQTLITLSSGLKWKNNNLSQQPPSLKSQTQTKLAPLLIGALVDLTDRMC